MVTAFRKLMLLENFANLAKIREIRKSFCLEKFLHLKHHMKKSLPLLLSSVKSKQSAKNASPSPLLQSSDLSILFINILKKNRKTQINYERDSIQLFTR